MFFENFPLAKDTVELKKQSISYLMHIKTWESDDYGYLNAFERDFGFVN